ncbi:MAG: CDP-glycerol glycerophosphotransferase family protein [Eubacterium sp.]|nr:CDP-glycerol glycerophosphotransferase family protein [Eubacterium sp.]
MAVSFKKKLGMIYWNMHNGFQISLYKKWAKNKKADRKIVLFESMLGRNYSCNPKAVYEEMMERGLDKKYECWWIRERGCDFEVPGNARIVTRNSLKYHKLMAKAGTWVFNTRQPDYIVKRKDQTYIQTWHGTPLKLLALDMEDVFMAGNGGIESYKSNFWRHSRRWDYLVSPSPYTDEIFARCFDFDKNMIQTGYPRNDVLVNRNNKEYIDSLKDKFNLPKDKKIILYAPTWRDNESISKGKYIFNPHINFDKLYREFKDEYVFIVKYHYLIADKLDFSRFRGMIRAIDTDISDLYLVSDIHMTDYSSTMFDYAVLDRPLIFYTYDLEGYFEGRGVYFDFEADAPGPLIGNTEDLIEFLKAPDFSAYQDKYRAFREKFNCREDGKGSSRICDIIEEVTR